ncbi:MAG: DNA photolyase family protein [Parachlamydiales bacterium]|nr:DNA photolyase family protein [Parachlamydiales bacterium]
MFEKTLFIFRRDLRLHDNTGLIAALNSSELVIPCFIFTPDQIEKNPYRSEKCLQFMLECLEDLEEQLKDAGGKLYYFHGDPSKIVDDLKVDAVFVNRDYTPYSIARDKKIEAVCKKNKIEFKSFDDVLLHPPEDTLKADGKPYSIFTPYYRNASRLDVSKPKSSRKNNFYKKPIHSETKKFPTTKDKSIVKGGRTEGLKVLHRKVDYKNRDFPADVRGTSHLSPYLKFTVISPREVYYANSDLIRSLYWRDFFTHLAFFFPHVFGHAFHKKYDKLKWSENRAAFKKWCEGKTGFPIVDAGMRELNETGLMHNRVRMIAASFLVKDLHIDWREGEKYFAQHLIDYDPAVNNGNWQWAASTGADAQPYFRIFNPWAQQKKFDPDCEYIKKWVPELKRASAKEIHEGLASEPMLDHSKEAKITLKLYRSYS